MTDEQVVADIDAKIKAHRERIATLESGKLSIGNGPTLATGVNDRTQARIDDLYRQISEYEREREHYSA